MQVTITHRTCTITKEADDIIRLKFRDHQLVEIQDVKDYVRIFEELNVGKKFKVIIDTLDCFMDASTEAKKYFGADPEALKYRAADVILINTLPLKLIARFYIKWDKHPNHLAKIVNTEQEAQTWIEQLRAEEKGKVIAAS